MYDGTEDNGGIRDWNIKERKVGRLLVIINTQLECLQKACRHMIHKSFGLLTFSILLSKAVNVLKEYKQTGYLQSF